MSESYLDKNQKNLWGKKKQSKKININRETKTKKKEKKTLFGIFYFPAWKYIWIMRDVRNVG